MLSEAAPISNLDAAGLDSEVPANKTISLTPDQMDALSLGPDVRPGQIITIQLEYGSATETPTPDGDKEGAGSSADPNAPKMFTVISSITEVPDESPTGPDEDRVHGPDDEMEESPEEKALGFKRPMKSPRAGLPDTKRMREI